MEKSIPKESIMANGTGVERYTPNWLVDPMLQQQMKSTFGSGVGSQYATQGAWGTGRSDWASSQLAEEARYKHQGRSGTFDAHDYIGFNTSTGKFEWDFEESGESEGWLKARGRWTDTRNQLDKLNARLASHADFSSGSIGGEYADYTKGKGLKYNPFDAESLGASAAAFQGKTEAVPGGYQPLSVELFKQMKPGYYAGQVAEERQPLVQSLIGNRMSASGLGGDFAGYGARGQAEDISKQKYRGDVGGIYDEVSGLTSGALGDFYDILDSYRA